MLSTKLLDPLLLEILGLTAKEKVILEVLLSFKIAQSVLDVATKAQVPRMTAYDILNKLQKRKIVMKVNVDGKRNFWMLNRKIYELKVTKKYVKRK